MSREKKCRRAQSWQARAQVDTCGGGDHKLSQSQADVRLVCVQSPSGGYSWDSCEAASLFSLYMAGRNGYKGLACRPVALTVRASDSKSEGWGFESLLACHFTDTHLFPVQLMCTKRENPVEPFCGCRVLLSFSVIDQRWGSSLAAILHRENVNSMMAAPIPIPTSTQTTSQHSMIPPKMK